MRFVRGDADQDVRPLDLPAGQALEIVDAVLEALRSDEAARSERTWEASVQDRLAVHVERSSRASRGQVVSSLAVVGPLANALSRIPSADSSSREARWRIAAVCVLSAPGGEALWECYRRWSAAVTKIAIRAPAFGGKLAAQRWESRMRSVQGRDAALDVRREGERWALASLDYWRAVSRPA